jgi:hypothetical protein
MHRLKITANAYRMARDFGRGVLFSAWKACRMLFTGHTGRYRIFR